MYYKKTISSIFYGLFPIVLIYFFFFSWLICEARASKIQNEKPMLIIAMKCRKHKYEINIHHDLNESNCCDE